MKKINFSALLLLIMLSLPQVLKSQSFSFKDNFPTIFYKDYAINLVPFCDIVNYPDGNPISIKYRIEDLHLKCSYGRDDDAHFHGTIGAVNTSEFLNSYVNIFAGFSYQVSRNYRCTGDTRSNILVCAKKPVWKNLPNRCTNMNQSINLRNYIVKDAEAPWGTFSGTGVNGNTFDPNTAGVAMHTITYTDGSHYVTTKTIIVYSGIGIPTEPSGNDGICQNSSNTSHIILPITNANSYSWTITPSFAGVISGSGTTGTVNWNNIYSGTATIKVRAYNSKCGYSNYSDNESITVTPIPVRAATPVGSTILCQGTEQSTYSVTAVTNAKNYQFILTPSSVGVILNSNNDNSCIVQWSSSFSGNASLSVKAYNECGFALESNKLSININPLPNTSAKPTSSSLQVCQDSENSFYTTSGAMEARTYIWSIYPNSAGSITGTNLTSTVDWDAKYNGIASISVHAENHCGDGAESAQFTTEVIALPLIASIPSGDISICQGAKSMVYNSEGAVYASSHEWEISPVDAGVITSNGLQATVNFANDFHGVALLRIRGYSCGYGSWSDNLNITVNPLVSTPTAPTGLYELCQDNANVSYAVNIVDYADSYTWELLPTTAGILTNSNNNTSINWRSDFSGSVTLKVKATNQCNISDYSDLLNIEIAPLPSVGSLPTGITSLCQDSENSTYVVSEIVSANSYEWVLEPSTAGSISGVGTTASIEWNETFKGSALIKVRGVNTCGVGDFSEALQITITPLPEQAATPTGNGNICQGDLSIMFSSLGANYSNSYDWEISPSNAITSISDGTNRIVYIDFNPTFSGDVSIKVRGYSCDYGKWSDSYSFTVVKTAVTPNVPIGDVNVCQGILTSNYISSVVPDALYYNWILLPSNSGSVISTNETATINWNTSYVGSANLSLTAANNCSSSQPSEPLNITLNPSPGIAGNIFVNDAACQKEELNVTTDVINYAADYIWSVSPEIAGTFSENTKSTVFVPSTDYFGSIYLKVKGSNSCDEGYESSPKKVNIRLIPDAPLITLNDGYCPNNEIQLFNNTYTGDSYKWYNHLGDLISTNDTLNIVPNDNHIYSVVRFNKLYNCNSSATILDLNIYNPSTANFTTFTDSIEAGTVCILNAFQSINVSEYLWKIDEEEYSSVTSEFNYYQSTNGNYDVTLITTSNDGCVDSLTKTNLLYVYGGSSSLSNTLTQNILFVYPNPVKDLLNIESEQFETALIIDIIGRTVKSFELSPGHNSIDCSNLISGSYILKVGTVITMLLIQ